MQQMESTHDLLCGKTCPEHSRQTKAKISESYSKNSSESKTPTFQFLDLRGGRQRWAKAGSIVADGCSLAWRTLDAQYWGVPQRRRRIHLVADFRGQCAEEILFKRKGLSRCFAQSRETWNGIAFGTTYGTYSAKQNDGQGIGRYGYYPIIPLESHPQDSRIKIEKSNSIQSLNAAMGMGGGQVPLIMVAVDKRNQSVSGEGVPLVIAFNSLQDPISGEKSPALSTGNTKTGQSNIGVCYALDRAAFNQGENALYNFSIEENLSQTLVAKGPGAVCYPTGLHGEVCGTLDSNYFKGCDERNGTERELIAEYCKHRWVVRRLTPKECGRLQGMPDWWCNGVEHKDAPEYKMWGNGMALPDLMYVIEGMAKVLREEKINQLFGETA